MIKRICITFLVFFIFSLKVCSADCLIKDKSANSLSKYIDNNRKIITNITKWISNSDIKRSSNTKNHILNNLNKLITWDNYGSYFDYYVIFPISNDISKEVWRDYYLLENEWEWLTNYLNKIVKLWYDNILIEDVCNWIQEKCDFSWTSSKIIWKLIKNQSEIINIYRLTVMWKMTNYEKEKILQLVDNSVFINELEKNYWYWKNCTTSKWSFFTQILDKIKKIDFANADYKKWIKEWKDAWALLIWNRPWKNWNPELEKKLLQKELSRQWISWSKAEAILGNLERFNQTDWGWLTIDNNFITNSFKHLGQSIQREITKFQKNIIKEFSKDKSSENITIHNFLNKNEENKLTENIATQISEIYNKELPFIAIWDTNTDMIRVDIIDIHNNLNDSIEILEKLIPISEKVCNDQDRGNGRCDTN